jgi:cytochrome c
MRTVMCIRTVQAALAIGLGLCSAAAAVEIADAQITPPAAKSLDGAALFKQQCATCHTANLSDLRRQGPPLPNIVGQQAGKVDGFHYSHGFAQANFVWDEARLDAWLTNPQAVIPGAIMAYRQVKPDVRAAIITYLKGLH